MRSRRAAILEAAGGWSTGWASLLAAEATAVARASSCTFLRLAAWLLSAMALLWCHERAGQIACAAELTQLCEHTAGALRFAPLAPLRVAMAFLVPLGSDVESRLMMVLVTPPSI